MKLSSVNIEAQSVTSRFEMANSFVRVASHQEYRGYALLIDVGECLLVCYDWMLDTAAVYGDLLESAFDLYRTLLYKSLRLPLPKNLTEELRSGKVLTDYLWRGFVEPELTFEKPEKK
jgi:hypothetical protein